MESLSHRRNHCVVFYPYLYTSYNLWKRKKRLLPLPFLFKYLVVGRGCQTKFIFSLIICLSCVTLSVSDSKHSHKDIKGGTERFFYRRLKGNKCGNLGFKSKCYVYFKK